MTTPTRESNFLTLSDIAAWQIDYLIEEVKPCIVAALPALQRGAIWKAQQIEELWDSILIGLPIGGFLLSSYDKNKGIQGFKLLETPKNPTHHLLDGQQRATAIALGFFNPWQQGIEPKKVKDVLWLDLGKPPKGRDIEFVLRLVTAAHPWGYSRLNPNSRISVHQIRMALQAFKHATPKYKDCRPSGIPLTVTWPWDAEAPIPLGIMINAISQSNGDIKEAKESAWDCIKELPFMAKIEKEDFNDKAIARWQNQCTKVKEAFNNDSKESSEWSKRLDKILMLLDCRIRKSRVPIMKLDLKEIDSLTEEDQDNEKKDPVEALFIRVNTAGTRLEGEDLIYSLIKSEWIEAPDAIGKLTHRLASPARIALLASRLVLARIQAEKSGQNRLPLVSTPNVKEFRRLMRGLKYEAEDFFNAFKGFVEKDGLNVFEKAYKFLTTGEFALPPVLASELSQKSSEVFFLFLRWIDRMCEKGYDPMDLDDSKRSRVLGFLSSLAWFAVDKKKAVDAIWGDLQKCNPELLRCFFGKRQFKKTCQLDNRGNLRMIPLIDPKDLETALKCKILGHPGCQNTITSPDSDIWSQWNWWWDFLIERVPTPINETIHPLLYATKDKIPEGEAATDRIRDAWNHFMETIWDSRSLLLYAQRKWINKWFSDFDPSQPEFLEDKNRPWDYDHIHPQRYLQSDKGYALHNISRLIRDCHSSIGNLRAWPLEANRADGDISPREKLEIVNEEEKRYEIRNGKEEREASFVGEGDWEEFWKRCVPEPDEENKRIDRHYLANKEHYKEWTLLVNAIIWRLIAIYKEWYTTLKVGGIAS